MKHTIENKTFKFGTLLIPVSVELDEVIDYNEENGFTGADEEFNSNWVCANVKFTIHSDDNEDMGQVQWDGLNNEYSASCDGNVLYDLIKKALIGEFTDEFFKEGGWDDDPEEFRIGLEEDVLPKIVEFICNFGGEHIEASKA